MESFNRKLFLSVSLAGFVALGVAIVIAFRARSGEANELDPADYEDNQANTVVEVLGIVPLQRLPLVMTAGGPGIALGWPGPMEDLSTVVKVQEPADVEAFFRADLGSMVAGTIKRVTKGLNDRVRKGELLLEVEAPDRIQDVAEKEAVVEQRRKELDMVRAQVKIAAGEVKVAEEKINQKGAEVKVADAEKELRLDIWRRYEGLGQDKVVTPDVVVEKKKGFLVAEAGVVSARAAVQKAQAELEAARAKLEQVGADIKLKETLIVVANKDRDRAQAMLDYAKITAPFDGIIIKRNVDPGDFVQNSSTGRSEPLVSVVRTDIMTVVMKLPDAYAPFVTRNTRALLELPGRTIKGRVTRYSPSIHEKDRTMRVEMDLFNGTWEQYDRFILGGLSCFLPPQAPRGLESALALAAGQHVWKDNMKGSMDPFPAFPESPEGIPLTSSRQLLPRMYGTMRLDLQEFKEAYLIPSQAVFSVGGKSYVLLARDGLAHRVAVRVDAGDNRLAKVTLLIRKDEEGSEEEPQGLTGVEQIITTNQTEIADGQRVRVQLLKDWPSQLGHFRLRPQEPAPNGPRP